MTNDDRLVGEAVVLPDVDLLRRRFLNDIKSGLGYYLNREECAYLVSSRTDALDDVDDILEADVFVCAVAPGLVPYTDLAFLAESPARELLLTRAPSDFRVMLDLAPPPPLFFGDVCTALAAAAGFSKPTEDDAEIFRSLASDLHSMSSV